MSEHRHHGSWAVWLNDTDHVPDWGWTRIDVRPSNASHVTEEDAEWLRQVIREATARRRSSGTYTPSPAYLMQVLADELDAEAREYAEQADRLPIGDNRRAALLGRILGKKAAAQRIRNIGGNA